METLTAVLTVITAMGAVLLILARVLANAVPVANRLGRRVAARGTELALVVAGGSMLGSLYFSEIAHFVPCRMCWFQRIPMYPITLIALVGLIRKDRSARWYFVPLAVIGAGISTYHYLIEWGVLADSEACGLFGPACADVWFREWGFVSLALMALVGFVSIIVFNTVSFESVDPPQETS